MWYKTESCKNYDDGSGTEQRGRYFKWPHRPLPSVPYGTGSSNLPVRCAFICYALLVLALSCDLVS
jgi:hypothetical protein